MLRFIRQPAKFRAARHWRMRGTHSANGYLQRFGLPSALCAAVLLAMPVAGVAAGKAPPRKAPTVSISSPASGAVYTSAQTVSVAATATDDVGVTKVEFYDGATLKGTDTTSPYSYSW